MQSCHCEALRAHLEIKHSTSVHINDKEEVECSTGMNIMVVWWFAAESVKGLASVAQPEWHFECTSPKMLPNWLTSSTFCSPMALHRDFQCRSCKAALCLSYWGCCFGHSGSLRISVHDAVSWVAEEIRCRHIVAKAGQLCSFQHEF